MPNIAPIQPSFHAGEVSPEFTGRVDTDTFRYGLSECRNWMVLPQGPLLRRMGTRFFRKLAGLPRLFEFRGTNALNYLLALGSNAAKIYNDRGDPVAATAQNLITNGTFDGGANWTNVAQDSYLYYLDGMLQLQVLGSKKLPYAYQQFALPNQSVLTVKAKMDITPGAEAHWPQSHVIKIGTAPNKSDIFYTEFSVYEMTPRGGPHYHEVQTPVAVPAGIYYVTLTLKYAADYPAYGDTAKQRFDDVEVLTAVPEAGIPIPWTDDKLEALQLGYESGTPQALFTHPNVAPWFLKNPAVGQWDHGNVVFSDAPYKKAGDAGSGAAWAGAAWPGVVEVFNGRVYWAGLPTELNRIWGSAIGSVGNMLVGVDPDDAIDQNLAVKGAIRWLCGKRLLLMGTDIGEHSITGSTGLPLPGDMRLQDESAFGSSAVQARHIGDQAIYVSRDKREVHALSYSDEELAWVSRSLTFAARHMTAGGVKEIHFARSPFPCVIFVLYGGGLVACTYSRREKVTAWWRIDVGAPVHSAAVIETEYGADLWLAVRRELTGVFLEQLPFHEFGAQHLDAWSYTAGADLTAPQFAGLGKKAMVVQTNGDGIASGTACDGQLYDVDADGKVLGFVPDSLETIYAVGLPFGARAKTLPIEGANPAGTSQGAEVHFTELTARLYNSARPLLNGQRVGPGRPFSTPADEAEALVTGDMTAGSRTVTRGGVITIEANDPFRTQVCAVFGRANASTM